MIAGIAIGAGAMLALAAAFIGGAAWEAHRVGGSLDLQNALDRYEDPAPRSTTIRRVK